MLDQLVDRIGLRNIELVEKIGLRDGNGHVDFGGMKIGFRESGTHFFCVTTKIVVPRIGGAYSVGIRKQVRLILLDTVGLFDVGGVRLIDSLA